MKTPRPNRKPSITGARIRERREHLGITQEKLAEFAGLDRVTISKLENGERQRAALSTLEALSPALGVSVDYLLGEMHSSPVEPQIEAYIAHHFGQADRPTPDEIEWLKSQGEVLWRGMPSDPETLHELIKLHRKNPARM